MKQRRPGSREVLCPVCGRWLLPHRTGKVPLHGGEGPKSARTNQCTGSLKEGKK